MLIEGPCIDPPSRAGFTDVGWGVVLSTAWGPSCDKLFLQRSLAPVAVVGGRGSAGRMVPGRVLMAQKAEPGLVLSWAGLGRTPPRVWLAAASEFGDCTLGLAAAS